MIPLQIDSFSTLVDKNTKWQIPVPGIVGEEKIMTQIRSGLVHADREGGQYIPLARGCWDRPPASSQQLEILRSVVS
jgi:hypothetical protein